MSPPTLPAGEDFPSATDLVVEVGTSSAGPHLSTAAAVDLAVVEFVPGDDDLPLPVAGVADEVPPDVGAGREKGVSAEKSDHAAERAAPGSVGWVTMAFSDSADSGTFVVWQRGGLGRTGVGLAPDREVVPPAPPSGSMPAPGPRAKSEALPPGADDISPPEHAPLAPAPLAGAPAADVAGLREGFRTFLRRLESLMTRVASSRAGLVVTPVVTAVVSTVLCGVARWGRKKGPLPGLVLLAGAPEKDTDPWLPDPSHLAPGEPS